MKKFNLGLSIAAGLLGGLISHFAWVQPVRAQSQLMMPPTSIRAQNFVLVDSKGVVQGVFSIDEPKNGPAGIKLLNGQGREIWRAPGRVQILTTSSGTK
jgi:hypothetical protein